MRLIITRPEEDALPLKVKLESRGHTAILAPLLKIVPRPGAYVPPLAYQLICTTSANALKFLNIEDRLKTIPLVAVGPQSLSTARENDFKFAEAHGGDVQGLAAHVAAKFDPQKGPVLYLSGAETSADLQALLMASGFAVERVSYNTRYRTESKTTFQIELGGIGSIGNFLGDNPANQNNAGRK